ERSRRRCAVAGGCPTSSHSSSSIRRTRARRSAGGSWSCIARESAATPSSSFIRSSRQALHPRRCRRTSRSSGPSRVPSRCSGSSSRTSSHVMVGILRHLVAQTEQRRADPCLHRALRDALERGYLGGRSTAEVGELQGGALLRCQD